MRDKKIIGILRSDVVPPADKNRIAAAAFAASAALAGEKRPLSRPFSLLKHLPVQLTYLSKWFYLQCAVFALLVLMVSAALSLTESRGTEYMTAVYMAAGPLFAVPCVSVLRRPTANGMFELEAACKYSPAKIFAGKMLLTGLFAMLSILLSWLTGAFLWYGYTLLPALLALTSFTVTAALILGFGGRALQKGYLAALLWEGTLLSLACGEENRVSVNGIPSGFAALLFVAFLAALAAAAIRYLKNLSLEGETCYGTLY